MAYNGCKIRNYSRINPNTGTGFILSRLTLRGFHTATKREVYEGTRYETWRPGFHSSIWAKLLEDGLISPWNGFMDVDNPHKSYSRGPNTFVRARGQGAGKNYTVKYFITERGRDVLRKMNERLDAIKKAKQEFCARNGIQFGTGKTLSKDEIAAICKNAGLIPVEEAVPDGKAALDKLEHFDPDLAERLDNIIRELQEIRASL